MLGHKDEGFFIYLSQWVWVVGWLLASTIPVNAETVKISLIPGDSYSKAVLEAVKALKNELPEMKKIEIQVYPVTDIQNYDLQYLRESRLVVMRQMGSELDPAKNEVREVLNKKGKVYAIGTYSEEEKNIGVLVDEKLKKYFGDGGVENIRNGILYLINGLGIKIPYEEPLVPPKTGIYDRRTGKIFQEFQDYQNEYAPFREGRAWIGIVFHKEDALSGNTKHIDALIQKLEESGFNALPIVGFPESESIEKYFFDEQGRGRVHAVIAVSMKFSLSPSVYIPMLTKLNVPVINAITLYSQSKEEWEKSEIGLNILDRGWQVATTELVGIIQPTVFSTKERVQDEATGMSYVETRPVPDRVDRLVQRVKAWVNLQDKPNKEKIIAVMYWNSPPGQERIGASYLNVLPESLWQIYRRLEAEGYDVGESSVTKEELFNQIMCCARNIGNWDQKKIDELAESGRATLIPLETYQAWFDQIPEAAKKKVLDNWGPPEKSKIMIWRNREGKQHMVIPSVRLGNVIFAPQPARGWAEDPEKLYHNTTLAPHHQYIAFYMWLKKVMRMDAIVSVGVHGSHEWLPGKEVGFSEDDFSEFLLKETPNIYPFIVDNVGEGTQAKRRGMAVMIDHLIPPLDKAGLNPELKELTGLLSDYELALGKSLSLAQTKLEEINKLAKKIGILKDIGMKEITMPSDENPEESSSQHEDHEEDGLHKLEHYIDEVSEELTPFGLHTLGVAPEEKYRRSTAEAIMSIEKNVTEEEREKRIHELEDLIVFSAKNELDSLVAGLGGRYVPAGPGNDPVRNPSSLPTGRNFYSFDPRKVPAKGTYDMGVRLAKELLAGYQTRHGESPDKLTFTLWAVETIRHEGVQESQILYLMGIKPKWNERGTVTGVEAIPRAELGRPRIDVTIVPTGLYRDMFSSLMDFLDQGVTLAKQQTEEDNILRNNVLKTKAILVAKGVSDDLAERLATVRIFTEPTGAYGTNLTEVIPLSHTWDTEKQVIDVYFMRLGYMFGQGFWSENTVKGAEGVGLTLFKGALSGSKMVVHSDSSNNFAMLDNDDVFQYLGGTAMAIRNVDGKSPEVYLTNMANPKEPAQESLDKMMGREMRSRYLNPAWIQSMMGEGYAGAKFVNQVFEYLWGFQVTVPEVVDAAKWNEMYETYILDKHGLDIENQFRKANNIWAYQEIAARMLEAVRKGYWKPDQEVIDNLSQVVQSTIVELNMECSEAKCGNQGLTKLVATGMVPVPAKIKMENAMMKPVSVQTFPPMPSPRAPYTKLEGFELKEQDSKTTGGAVPIPYVFLAGVLILIALLTIGWRRRTR